MKRFSFLKKEGGFTLIELLVVMLIIGILILIAAPTYLGQTNKAHQSAAMQNMEVIYQNAKAYAVGPNVGSDGTTNPQNTFTGYADNSDAVLQAGEPEFVKALTDIPPTITLAVSTTNITTPGDTLQVADVEGGHCYSQKFDVVSGPVAIVDGGSDTTAQSTGLCG